MYDVTALDKRMTAFVIPNAIQITTRGAKYTFTSFLSRDTTYDVIYNVWRLARPEDSSIGSQLGSARESLEANHDGPASGGVSSAEMANGSASPTHRRSGLRNRAPIEAPTIRSIAACEGTARCVRQSGEGVLRGCEPTTTR